MTLPAFRPIVISELSGDIGASFDLPSESSIKSLSIRLFLLVSKERGSRYLSKTLSQSGCN
jgi:hypothetical protein